MLATTANKLKSGDEFTSNEGTNWHHVIDVIIIKQPSSDIVLLTTDDYQKIWLWAEEDVVVRL